MSKKKKKNKRKAKTNAAPIDPTQTQAALAERHLLYERAVQCVEAEIDMVDETFEKLRGRKAETLREDFCGTANTSCEWVRRRNENRAWGVDLDKEVLDWGMQHRVTPLNPEQRQRIELINEDVLSAKTPQIDAILAMNFSYWIFKTRDSLRNYFSKVRDSLSTDGIFFLDFYGGSEAMSEMEEETDHGDFSYVWD